MLEDWQLVQLARWLGVPLWELLAQPLWLVQRLGFYREVEEGLLRQWQPSASEAAPHDLY